MKGKEKDGHKQLGKKQAKKEGSDHMGEKEIWGGNRAQTLFVS